jgi:5'-3' exonuclease
MKTEKDLKCLIDADVLQYRCGFAADAQIKREAKQSNPDISDEELKALLLETDYEAYALNNVKTVLDYLIDRFNPEYKIYIHDGGNFRHDLATLKPYKGNRDPNGKPKYYKEIKDYLLDNWSAIPVRGQESDDAIGIEQFDNSDKYTVIVSTDKDMKMIPGWHFNWVKNELVYQPIKAANNFLFYQMLVGDTSDNIPGINKIGDKRATDLIVANDHNIDLIREEVKKLYQKQYGEEWEQAYHEVGNLLWIRRKPQEECPLL